MDKKSQLEQIAANVRNCKKCRLCETAKNAVPGEGDLDAEIVFIGEAPGATEDETGRPFVGRAGRLLDKLLHDIGMTRENVWIGNVIKHRPPENRDPLPDEITACMPYLTMQLALIKPKLVVTLGRYAMNYFHKDGKISRDHGCSIKQGNYSVYPLYHPAAALRNPSVARELVVDFRNIPKVLEDLRNPPSVVAPSTTAQEVVDKDQLGLGI